MEEEVGVRLRAESPTAQRRQPPTAPAPGPGSAGRRPCPSPWPAGRARRGRPSGGRPLCADRRSRPAARRAGPRGPRAAPSCGSGTQRPRADCARAGPPFLGRTTRRRRLPLRLPRWRRTEDATRWRTTARAGTEPSPTGRRRPRRATSSSCPSLGWLAGGRSGGWEGGGRAAMCAWTAGGMGLVAAAGGKEGQMRNDDGRVGQPHRHDQQASGSDRRAGRRRQHRRPASSRGTDLRARRSGRCCLSLSLAVRGRSSCWCGQPSDGRAERSSRTRCGSRRHSPPWDPRRGCFPKRRFHASARRLSGTSQRAAGQGRRYKVAGTGFKRGERQRGGTRSGKLCARGGGWVRG